MHTCKLQRQNPTLTTEPEAKLGFTRFAELWNGLIAMLGFVVVVIGELVTGEDLLSQMGLM